MRTLRRRRAGPRLSGLALCCVACGLASAAEPPGTLPFYSRFQVVGLSRTHLALRELFDLSSHPADCAYRITPKTLGEHGVRIHLLPYRPGQLLAVRQAGAEVFPIYDSVTRKEECTSLNDAATRLSRAKTEARAKGVEMDARATPILLGASPLAARACVPEPGEEPSCEATYDALESRDLRVRLEATRSPPQAKLSLSVGNGTQEMNAIARATGAELQLEPLQLYHFPERAALLAVFRNGAGPDLPYALVVEPLAGEEDEWLAPLVTTQ